MMLVCSTAHMFHYRWFVQLERTPSSQKLDLRQDTVLFQTHSLKVLLKDLDALLLTATAITSVLLFRTSCKSSLHTLERDSFGGLFFCYIIILNVNIMEDEELLDELAERIAEGPIIFTPDEDWVDQLNNDD